MKSAVLFLLSGILLFNFAVICMATAYVNVDIGIKSGNWMKYNIVSEERNFTGWLRLNIVSVDGTFFRFNTTTYSDSFGYINATGKYNMSEMDSQSIAYPDDTIEFFVIPSNLKTGDVFYYYNWGSTTIAGENNEKFVSATRQLIYATYVPPVGMQAEATKVDYTWDKITGVVVEYLAYYSDGKTTSAKLIDTNVWQPDQNISLYLWVIGILIAAIIVAVSMFVAVRKRKRKS
jgi:hypothetical protein